jgi:hypothetical protein
MGEEVCRHLKIPCYSHDSIFIFKYVQEMSQSDLVAGLRSGGVRIGRMKNKK